MAKQDQKARKSKVGFGGVKTSFITRTKILLQFIFADIRGWFGSVNKTATGIRVGANVVSGQVAVNVMLDNGTDVTVAMNINGARQIINELQKAIDVVRFKGR